MPAVTSTGPSGRTNRRPQRDRRPSFRQRLGAARSARRFVALMAAASAAQAASAVERYWQTTNGTWNVAANWGTAPGGTGTTGLPNGGDNPDVIFTDPTSRTVTYVNPVFSGTYGVVTFDNTGSAVSTLSQGQDTLSAANETFGVNGSGRLLLSAGVDNVGALVLGNNVTGKGSVTLSGTGVLNAGSVAASGTEYVAVNGSATFTQTGGSNNFLGSNGGSLYVGYGAGSVGTYTLQGGALNVNSGFAQEIFGFGGSGTMNQSGGANTASNISVGYIAPSGTNAGGAGIYNLSGGTVTVQTLLIGQGGAATFNQTGGTVNESGNLYLGGPSATTNATGTYNLSAGTLTTGAIEFLGYTGVGTLNQSGGVHNANGTLILGVNAGSVGNYTLSGSGSLVSTGSTLGSGGIGNFTQTGGTNAVNSNFYGLELGSTPSGTGNYNLAGGTLAVTGPNAVTDVGNSGTGNFTQSAGQHLTGSLQLADQSGSTGNYFLSGGTLSAAAVYDGLGGNGTFRQTGGTSTVSGALFVGNANSPTGSGTYVLSGGSLNVGTTFSVGGAGPCSVVQVGGVANATTLQLVSGGATYVLDGAGVLNATSQEIVGASGAGNSFTQYAGTHFAGSLMIASGTGSAGSLTLASGTLTVATTEVVGGLGAGTFVQGGGTHTVGTGLTIAQSFGSTGSYALNGGSLTAPITNNGTFTEAGGTLAGSFTNNGSFTFNGSSNFSSAFVQTATGVMTLNASLTTPSGVTNAGTVSLPNGVTLTTNGAPFDNEGGTLTLNGGTLNGTGNLINNGVVTGFGTLGGSGSFSNNGVLTVNGGNVALNRVGPSVNAGAINLASGRQLQLLSSLSNLATLSLNGGFVTGPQTLVNAAGGVVFGPGTIIAPLGTNAGLLVAQGGALNVTQPFVNAGAIQVNGVGASLIGAAVTNAGTVQGFGSVNNPLDNAGTVEAIGGTLALTGALTTEATGVLRASTGNKLLLAGPSISNVGTLSLTGGTIDANGKALTNTGTIAGFGTLATGGLTNASGGQVTFSGGLATINGPVTNAVGGTVRVSYTPAIFTHPVVNFGTMKITSTTVTFAAPFTNNGLYTSDPATTHYSTVTVGAPGAMVGGQGDRFFVSGDFLSASTQAAQWDTADGAELHFEAGGNAGQHTMTLTGADRGPTAAGYDDNFAWGTVALDAGQTLTLADGNASPGGAVYASIVSLEGAPTDGTLAAYIAAHVTNADATTPMDLYYDATQPANAYLAGKTYPLGNGGVLAGVFAVPEPASATVLIALGGVLLKRRRMRPTHA